MPDSRLFFGGLPTEIDVKKLVERFGTPAAGTLISYEEIGACIGHNYKTDRFKTIVERWRKKLMREHNTDTAADPGRGIKVLTPSERTGVVQEDFKANTRALRRTAIRTAVIPEDGLTDEEKKKKQHLQGVTARLFMAQANELKAMRPPTAPPALPKRATA